MNPNLDPADLDDTRDEDYNYNDADPGDMDGDHASALESAYGPEDDYLDAAYEDRFDGGDF